MKTLVVALLLSILRGSSAEESSEPCLSDVHTALRDIRAELAVLQFKMEQQQSINQELTQKVQGFEGQTCHGGSNGAKPVAFSASLLSGTTTMGPFRSHYPLAYTNVETNIGDAYNPSTGEFRAPVKGAYHFEFYATGEGLTAVVLVKNGRRIFAASKHTPSFSTTANGATLVLEVGDVVCLHLWPGHVIYDNANRHSTFSGRLLFSM